MESFWNYVKRIYINSLKYDHNKVKTIHEIGEKGDFRDETMFIKILEKQTAGLSIDNARWFLYGNLMRKIRNKSRDLLF